MVNLNLKASSWTVGNWKCVWSVWVCACGLCVCVYVKDIKMGKWDFKKLVCLNFRDNEGSEKDMGKEICKKIKCLNVNGQI